MRVLLVSVLFVLGCSSAPAVAPSPTLAPPPASSPTAAPTRAATPTAAPPTTTTAPAGEVLDLCAEEREACELEAGTYSPSRTTPKVTFVLEEGWTGVRHYEDGFALTRPEAILSFARDILPGTGGEMEPGLAGIEAFLRGVSALRVDQATVAVVGGLPAVQLDVVAAEDARAFFELDKDVYNLAPGQKARFWIVDVDGTIGLFIVESEDEASFAAAIEAGQPVIDSIRFD